MEHTRSIPKHPVDLQRHSLVLLKSIGEDVQRGRVCHVAWWHGLRDRGTLGRERKAPATPPPHCFIITMHCYFFLFLSSMSCMCWLHQRNFKQLTVRPPKTLSVHKSMCVCVCTETPCFCAPLLKPPSPSFNLCWFMVFFFKAEWIYLHLGAIFLSRLT